MTVVKYPSCPYFLSCKINLKNRKINMSSNSGLLAREAVGHCSGRTWALESDGLETLLLHDFEQVPFLGSLICKMRTWMPA